MVGVGVEAFVGVEMGVALDDDDETLRGANGVATPRGERNVFFERSKCRFFFFSRHIFFGGSHRPNEQKQMNSFSIGICQQNGGQQLSSAQEATA